MSTFGTWEGNSPDNARYWSGKLRLLNAIQFDADEVVQVATIREGVACGRFF